MHHGYNVIVILLMEDLNIEGFNWISREWIFKVYVKASDSLKSFKLSLFVTS